MNVADGTDNQKFTVEGERKNFVGRLEEREGIRDLFIADVVDGGGDLFNTEIENFRFRIKFSMI